MDSFDELLSSSFSTDPKEIFKNSTIPSPVKASDREAEVTISITLHKIWKHLAQ